MMTFFHRNNLANTTNLISTGKAASGILIDLFDSHQNGLLNAEYVY